MMPAANLPSRWACRPNRASAAASWPSRRAAPASRCGRPACRRRAIHCWARPRWNGWRTAWAGACSTRIAEDDRETHPQPLLQTVGLGGDHPTINRRRRRIAAPVIPNPAISIAQLACSGTVEVTPLTSLTVVKNPLFPDCPPI